MRLQDRQDYNSSEHRTEKTASLKWNHSANLHRVSLSVVVIAHFSIVEVSNLPLGRSVGIGDSGRCLRLRL
jgi:hypothetical protein